MVADAVFDQEDDGVVVVLTEEVPEGEVEHAREAVKLCPASALKLRGLVDPSSVELVPRSCLETIQ